MSAAKEKSRLWYHKHDNIQTERPPKKESECMALLAFLFLLFFSKTFLIAVLLPFALAVLGEFGAGILALLVILMLPAALLGFIHGIRDGFSPKKSRKDE